MQAGYGDRNCSLAIVVLGFFLIVFCAILLYTPQELHGPCFWLRLFSFIVRFISSIFLTFSLMHIFLYLGGLLIF